MKNYVNIYDTDDDDERPEAVLWCEHPGVFWSGSLICGLREKEPMICPFYKIDKQELF